MAYNRVDLFSAGSEKTSSSRVSLTSAAKKGTANRGEYISKRNSAKADDFGSHLSKASAKANRADSNGGIVSRETVSTASQPAKQNVVKVDEHAKTVKSPATEVTAKADTVSKATEPVKPETKIKDQADYSNDATAKAIAQSAGASDPVLQQTVQGKDQAVAVDEIPVQEGDEPEASAVAQNPYSASAILQFMSHSNSIESLLSNRHFNPMPMQRVAMPVAEAMIQSAAQNIQGAVTMNGDPQQMVQQLKSGAQQLSAAVQSMMEAVEDVIDLPDGFKEVARQALQPNSVEALLTPVKGDMSAQTGQGMLNMLSGNIVPRQNMVWQQSQNQNVQAPMQSQVNTGEIMPNIQGNAETVAQTPQVKVDNIQGIPVEVQTSPGATETAMLNMLSGGMSFRGTGSYQAPAVNQAQVQMNVQPAVEQNAPQIQPVMNEAAMPATNQAQVQANAQPAAMQVNTPQVQSVVDEAVMPAVNQVQVQANAQPVAMQVNTPQVQPVVDEAVMPAINQVQVQANVQPAAMQVNTPQVQPVVNEAANQAQIPVNEVAMPVVNQAQVQVNAQPAAMQVNASQVQPVVNEAANQAQIPVNEAAMPAVNQAQVQANVQPVMEQPNAPQVQPVVNEVAMPATNQEQAPVQQTIVAERPETVIETVVQAVSSNSEVSARTMPAVNPEPVVINNNDQPRGNVSVGDAPRITPEALEAVNQTQEGNNNPSGYEGQRNQQQGSFFQQSQQMVQPTNSQGQVQPIQMPGEAAFDAAPVENVMQDTSSVAGANFQQMLNNTAEARNTQQVQQPQQSSTDYEVPKQIVEHARMIKAGQNTEMVIKLNPQHLGELTLKVAVNGNGGVTATFHSDNATVRGIIETSMMQLKQELTEQGIKVDRIEISSGLQQDLQDMGQGYYAQQGRQGQRTMSNQGNANGYENGEGIEGEGGIAGVDAADGVPVNRSTESICDNQGNIISGRVDYAV